MTAVAAAGPTRPLKRVIAASLIGTTIEWYDFFLYGTAAALVFNKVFFPKSDPLVGTMLAFGTYALGFAARPVGGVVFGHFGDRIGRKRLLMLSLILMGVSTVAMGLLPTYGQIGAWAAILLTLLRLIQGFAVGGEWGGAVLLVAEHSPASRRAFWASWPQAGVPIGNLLAAGVLAVMSATQSQEEFLRWGWRVPFLLSAILVAIGWWVRVSVAESPLFAELEEERRHAAPAMAVVRQRPGGIAIGAGLRIGENISYYVITIFSITYVTEVYHLERGLALEGVLVGAALEAITLPLFALLADRIGRRPVYALGAAGMALWAFAMFRLLDLGSNFTTILAIAVALILHGAMYGPQAAFICELFPTSLRYSGASIAYQVTSIFAGSLAPIIAIALMRRFDSSTPIAIYVAVACAASCASALLARETRGQSFAAIDTRLEGREAAK
jgi:metabolite-proton symporter